MLIVFPFFFFFALHANALLLMFSPLEVQAHAASAILNFSENCTPEILTPYLDGIISKLLVLLQNGKQMVQEGALTALASVADSSQVHKQHMLCSIFILDLNTFHKVATKIKALMITNKFRLIF
jgi:hypothetical protein